MRSPDQRHLSTHSLRGVWGALILGAAIALTACGDTETEVNQAPTLTLDVGAQESYVIGDLIQIRASAEDPDSDPLTFSVQGLPERAELQTFPNSALMSWDPIASDVTGGEGKKLVFVVEDDRGGRSERVVHLNILAGNGTPSFASPSSKLFNPRSGQALTFEVKVRDDDSAQVFLSMPAETAPEGATFEQTDAKVGTFTWTPTVAQISQRVHSATFVAEDNQGAPVKQKVTIILQSSTGGDPGNNDPTSPTPGGSTCDDTQLITHAAPSAQRTVDDYELEAYLSPEGAQKYDQGMLFWSTINPMQYEVDMESIDMKVGAGLMRAGIPNLLLQEGEYEIVYYTICAFDSTADANADDTFVCAPANHYYSFVAHSPDTNYCADDSTSGTSFANAAEVSGTEWVDYLTCAGADDYHKVTVPAGELAEVYMTYSLTGAAGTQTLTHPMDITVYDEDQNPVELAEVSECSGIAYMLMQAPPTQASTWYIKVSPSGDSQTPYQLTAFHSEPDIEPPPVCEDDDTFGSTNRSTSDAPFIDDGEYTGLTVCGGESSADWYTNILAVGDQLFAELAVEQGADVSDIYFAAYGSTGGLRGVGAVEGDKLILELEATAEDFYYYIVEAPSETRYTLFFATY